MSFLATEMGGCPAAERELGVYFGKEGFCPALCLGCHRQKQPSKSECFASDGG